MLFSQGWTPSIVTAARLNFCVRDGNRCLPCAMGTEFGICDACPVSDGVRIRQALGGLRRQYLRFVARRTLVRLLPILDTSLPSTEAQNPNWVCTYSMSRTPSTKPKGFYSVGVREQYINRDIHSSERFITCDINTDFEMFTLRKLS